jgi:hypothetical protein
MSTRRIQAIAVRILFAGVVLLVLGIFILASSDGDPTDIWCDGQKMTSGYECGNYRDGFRSYEELVESKRESNAWERTNGPLVIGLGAVIILSAGLALLFAAPGARAGSSIAAAEHPAEGATAANRPWWSEGEQP